MLHNILFGGQGNSNVWYMHFKSSLVPHHGGGGQIYCSSLKCLKVYLIKYNLSSYNEWV